MALAWEIIVRRLVPGPRFDSCIQTRVHKNLPAANYLRNLMALTGVPTIALA
jgi:hypothetical protein